MVRKKGETRGRRKKRGRKKKKPIVERKYVGLKRPYHIITSNNGVQIKDIYTAVSIDVGLRKMKEIQERMNEGVEFPVKFTCSKDEVLFTECDYRLILIKKRDEGDALLGKIKNDFGKYIDCDTGNKNWLYIDSLPYKIEETFWVYGYNPNNQRKTYRFIMDNIVASNVSGKYQLKQVVVYRNKVVITSVDKFDMVICKNHIDSVRLYNAMEEEAKKRKMKYVMFSGDVAMKSVSRDIWEEKIRNATHWTYRKINKNTTRD